MALELLKRNFQLKLKDKDGRTALSYTAAYSNTEVLKLLIEKGASINALTRGK